MIDSVIESVTDSVTKFVTDSVTESVNDSVIESVTESVTESMTDFSGTDLITKNDRFFRSLIRSPIVIDFFITNFIHYLTIF